MKIVLTAEARSNLREIQAYIARDNVSAAGRVAATIRTSIDILATYPLIGTAYEGDIRRLNITRYPYSVFYRVDTATETVIVISIRHGARTPPDFR